MIAGTLVNVEDDRLGSVATAAAAIGAVFLQVEDLNDFDFDGGTLQAPNGQVVGYTVPDDESGLALDAPLTGAVAIGDHIYLYPAATERRAWILTPQGGEPLPARVPIQLRDRVWLGVRDLDVAEDVRADYEDPALSTELVLSDVLGQEPAIDATFVDTKRALPSDGVPPASSPTPSILGGPTFLSVTWPGITNADPVTYEVHISDTTGFLPTSSTRYVELRGTGIIVKSLPGGAPLVYGTTYYAKIIAKDPDGAAPASVQAAGQMAQINSPDIAANAVTANQIAADAVTAAKIDVANLQAISGDMGVLTAGRIDGATWRTSATNPMVRIDGPGGIADNGMAMTQADGEILLWLDTGGLRLKESASLSPSVRKPRAISWLDSGLNLRGQIAEAAVAGSHYFEQNLYDAAGGFRAGISLQDAGPGLPTSVYAGAGTQQPLIIGNTGQSDFALLARASVFTARQTFAASAGAVDGIAADFRRGTDTSPTSSIARFRNAADTANLAVVSPEGYGDFFNGVGTQVAAGAVSDASYGVQAKTGSLGIDTLNKRIYARLGTVWNFAPLSNAALQTYTLGAFTPRRAGISNADTLVQTQNTLATLIQDLQARGMLL